MCEGFVHGNALIRIELEHWVASHEEQAIQRQSTGNKVCQIPSSSTRIQRNIAKTVICEDQKICTCTCCVSLLPIPVRTLCKEIYGERICARVQRREVTRLLDWRLREKRPCLAAANEIHITVSRGAENCPYPYGKTHAFMDTKRIRSRMNTKSHQKTNTL